MIAPRHPVLPITGQCALIGGSRSAWYGPGKSESPLNLALRKLIGAQFMETPFYGSRQMARQLRNQGCCVGRKRIRRLMAGMGLRAVCPRPRTMVPHPEHRRIPICSGTWGSSARTRSDARRSPTFRCGVASPTSS